jgi:nucleotidyltransferase substrate binding protein (TIGR01987 family)
MKSDQKRLEASKQKAADSLRKLERSLQWLDADISAADRWARFDAVAKRFEVAFEYTWKAFKTALDSLGVETYGPKDSISAAATYRWIEDVERWVMFLETRNAGVHDYFGVSEDEYANTARMFLKDARTVLQRLP